MKHVVSFSGGKDSTAMLLMMIEKGMPIDEIIFCDTGKEFPAMYDHIEKVENYIGRKITILKSNRSFDYNLGNYHVHKLNGNIQIGKGWPDFKVRWCTCDLKRDIMNKYLKNTVYTLYIGIAADEPKRIHNGKDKRSILYPLVDFGVTEKQALAYCYSKGFDWDGLYKKFVRVSCYCCPLQRLGELKTIYFEFPELWEDMRKLDKLSFRKFRSDYSLSELEEKFEIAKRRNDEG